MLLRVWRAQITAKQAFLLHNKNNFDLLLEVSEWNRKKCSGCLLHLFGIERSSSNNQRHQFWQSTPDVAAVRSFSVRWWRFRCVFETWRVIPMQNRQGNLSRHFVQRNRNMFKVVSKAITNIVQPEKRTYFSSVTRGQSLFQQLSSTEFGLKPSTLTNSVFHRYSSGRHQCIRVSRYIYLQRKKAPLRCFRDTFHLRPRTLLRGSPLEILFHFSSWAWKLSHPLQPLTFWKFLTQFR